MKKKMIVKINNKNLFIIIKFKIILFYVFNPLGLTLIIYS